MIEEPEQSLIFEQWITYVFDHPVTDPRWYWKEDAYYWDGPDNVVISYLTRTFSECDKVLSVYSDEQVAQGLWFLIDNSSCNYALAVKNGDLPLDTRIECINSMATVLERYFAPRCSHHLLHLQTSESVRDVNPLNGICYMWWDILPIHALAVPYDLPDDTPGVSEEMRALLSEEEIIPGAEEIDAAVLRVIRKILSLDSIPCQESALFGLAYWSYSYPEVYDWIDEFIESHPELWNRFRTGVKEALFSRE